MKTKLPYLIGLLTMAGGVMIAIIFGINEDIIQDKIARGLQQNVHIQQMADGPEKVAYIKGEQSKNWRYYQRYHFHSTGIGAMILAVLVLLNLFAIPECLKLICSYLTSVGGFLYPYVWLFAGIYGPSMGRHEAKESFAIFGYMGGVFLIGILMAFVLVAKYPKNNT